MKLLNYWNHNVAYHDLIKKKVGDIALIENLMD